MKRILILSALLLVGLGAGAGAGYWLRPTDVPPSEPAAPDPAHQAEIAVDYAKLANPFIVPLIEDGRITSLVVLSLSLEVPAQTVEAVHAKEPRLRDSFLQILFDHANIGGFRGSFTDGANLATLRRTLLEAARLVLGDSVSEVLITDIARQDG